LCCPFSYFLKHAHPIQQRIRWHVLYYTKVWLNWQLEMYTTNSQKVREFKRFAEKSSKNVQRNSMQT